MNEERQGPIEEQSEERERPAPVVVVENPEELVARDDEAIIAMMTGQAIEDYVYTFRQGGRVVEGLTLAGINEAANRLGGIQVEEIRYEETETSWIAIVKATDTYTGSSRYGAYEQPKKVNGREDPYAFTKAIHKAQRNAIKQLLPANVVREVIDFYLHRGRRPSSAPAASEPEPAEPKQDKITNHQKAAFSAATKLRERLERRGIGQEDFWNYVRRRFNVQSRNDMREDQWAQLAAELRAADDSPEVFEQLVTRIQRVLAPAREASPREEELRAEAEPEPAEPGTRRSPERPSRRPEVGRRQTSSAKDSLF
ncbi:MAG: hypothetical protein KatS3mg115_2346 [Candidatus Poribacteria bacterium]|nr:MAG: hypothetical protein KatS3mg115_2346 [Candidatus Poribacteria bacterium]